MRTMKRAGCAVAALILALALVLGLLFAVPVFAETQGQEDAVKQPVNYYLNAKVKKSLADNALTDPFNYFDGIRWTTEAYASQADNWWGYASVYMGLSANGEGVDLTQYETVNLEVWGISQSANWIIAGFVDGSGRYASLHGNAVKGTNTVLFDGIKVSTGESLTNYEDANSDWHGTYIGNLWGELKVRPKVITGAGDTPTYSLSDPAFDWTDVGAMFVRYHAWDAKTIQTGKVTLVDAEGGRTEAFDPAAAQQVTETKNLAGIGTLTNEQWYYGPEPKAADAHSYAELIAAGALQKASATYEASYDSSVWDIRKIKNGGDVWAQLFESAEGTASAAYTDISSYSGICLELDTKGLTSQSIQIDVAIKLTSDDIYKAFGNTVNASYVLENGTVVLNQDLETGANVIPQNVQGKMYIPFGAFELGDDKLLTDVENFGPQIIGIYLIFVNSSFAVGDAMTIKNVQAFVCDEHADANHDQLCDYCAADVPCTEHVDENHDQKCDYCEAEVPCTHTDADKDHECDWCGAEVNMPHADENHDQKCDYCGADVPCTHTDADKDHECDWCGAEVNMPHTDENHDQKCDYCGADVPCTEHVDENHDQKCDYCDAVVPCTEHVDEDHDQKCDYCDADVPCTHTDADKDHECDWCGAEVNMPHADENNDGKCDYCGAQMSTSDPDDGNQGGGNQGGDKDPGGDENQGGTDDGGKGGCSGSVAGMSFGIAAGVLVLAAGAVLVLRKKVK